MQAEETDTISIKIPRSMNIMLEKFSKEEDRSKSSVVRKALQEYLEDIIDTRAGLRALAKIEKGEAHFTSFDDLKKELGYVGD